MYEPRNECGSEKSRFVSFSSASQTGPKTRAREKVNECGAFDLINMYAGINYGRSHYFCMKIYSDSNNS